MGESGWIGGGMWGGTHWSNESSHHCKKEGEDGHQHAGLAEPPEDSGEGGSFPAALLQLFVPQLLQPGNTMVTDCCQTGIHSKSKNKMDRRAAESGRLWVGFSGWATTKIVPMASEFWVGLLGLDHTMRILTTSSWNNGSNAENKSCITD